MAINFKNTHNPILPLEYHIPDAEGHMMPDGKLYLYGSYDDRENVFCSTKYHVVSTDDLENWTLHDVSFTGEQAAWFNNPDAPHYQGIDWSRPTPFVLKMMEAMDVKEELEKTTENLTDSDWEKEPLLFAPDAIHKDGKYYLYFCMSDDSEGVAFSDRPEGPFTNPVQLPCGGIDPAIFVDEDGQAYYYWGQLYANAVKLNADMISFDEKQIVHNILTEQEHYFHEGSSMRKIGDTYYYVYANIEHGRPTSLGYSTSKSPLGPFTYRGVIIDNALCDPASWNNHGSIECVNGQWYVFYHRCSRGGQFHRRLCMEPIMILEDGSITEVKMTSQGAGKPFGADEVIYGYQACEVSGTVCIDVDGMGSEWLSSISDGDTATFRYAECGQGFRKADIRIKGSGKIHLLLNGVEAGSAEAKQQDTVEIPFECAWTERLEVKLLFEKPEDLKVISITLRA